MEGAFFGLTLAQFVCLGLYGFFMGFERSGVRLINMPIIPILMLFIDPKTAMGYMLPMVLISDIFSITYYKRSADWHILKRSFPGAIFGILLGAFIGKYLSKPAFMCLVGTIVIISLCFILYNDMQKKKELNPKATLFLGLFFAFCTGLSSMLGASGGPVILSFLLLLNLSKEKLIGTSAYFFFMVNICKLPTYFFAWHNISFTTILADITLIPVMALGLILGLLVVKHFTSKSFRIFIITMSFLSAVWLIISGIRLFL